MQEETHTNNDLWQGKAHRGRPELPYVVIFIPAVNEDKMIGDVIRKVHELYSGTTKRGYWADVIVIDDGSTDSTVNVARASGASRVVSHPFNRGLGAATRTGLQTAHEMGADIAVKIDADFQHDPDDIDKVIQPIIADRADAVFGSRLTGGLKYKMPLYRAAGNRFFSWLVSRLTGLKITDAQTGLMAFHRRYLAVFDIVSDYNETQQLIMDAWGKHFRVIEVPVVFHKRMTGNSFISFRYPFKVMPTILRMLVRGNPLKVFIPSGLILIGLGFLAGTILLFTNKEFYGDATVTVLLMSGLLTIFFGILADIISHK
jgi:glycosyltransferase involved in cell wall biosynthesis